MSSIIEGYNYDIFISYRQKDNKGDRWVSEFVVALKTELESTFKEEISVYFDINPHDGLLETHDVDASLKEKLKCLIFIPVLSRTYCDPKSFAWVHEFMVFVKQAADDQFGLKVKLPNGNVASRVLPVRIHDLDNEDVKLIEAVTGGVMRTLDFVFKTASGVNRPLKVKEDHPGDNLNKTYFQDQINKIALSTKEIIHGIKANPVMVIKIKDQTEESYAVIKEDKVLNESEKSIRSVKHRWLSAAAGTLLIIAAILAYPKIQKRDKFEGIRNADGKISVAVIPFENLTGDTTLNWFKKGISSLIINGLGNSSELAVCDDHTMFEVMESMNQVYTAGISPSLARDIARKAKAETYISGSFHGRENTYWILANLVSSETGNILWTNKVEGNLKASGYLDLADSLCNEIKNYLEIKALRDVADYDFREAYPKSAEAYRYFIEGMNLVLNQNIESGIQSLKKALEIDSTFTLASFYIAYANCYWGNYEQALLWTNITYRYKDRVPPKYQLWIEMWNAYYNKRDLTLITSYCDQLSRSGINTRFFWLDLGFTYYGLQQYEKAVDAFEKVMEINQERTGDLKFLSFWDSFLIALHKTGKHEREKEISEIGLKVIPEKSNWFFYRLNVCALSQGNTREANEIHVKYLAKHKELGTKEDLLELFLGQMYEEAGILDQAEIHYRKSDKFNTQNVYCILVVAQFLINNDRNVSEGMKLIQKVLLIEPANEWALLLEGWALYKQGNYEEAVQQLERLWGKQVGFSFDIFTHLEAAKKALAAKKPYV